MKDQIKIKNNFLKAIAKTITDFKMIDSGNAVLVAVSGGPDSVTLVLSLLALKDKYALKIGIAHLNHMLRGEESIRDQVFVKGLADKLNLPFFCEQIDVKAYARINRRSIEESGRIARYQFFNRIAKSHGFSKIATGHTKGDNAELVMMNLLRGAGPKGLSGIPPIRGGKYIRPLIQMSKNRILDFLKAENQSFVFDSSNKEMTFLRNKIRGELLPYLQSEYNPEIINALERLSSILRQEEDFWEIKTQKALGNCLVKTDSSCLVLSKPEITGLHPALLNRVLRKALEMIKKDLKAISFVHINDMVQFCFDSASGTSLDLPGQIRIYKNKDSFMIKKEEYPLREIGKKEKKMRQISQKKQG